MRNVRTRDRAGPVDIHLYPEVISIAGARHLNLAVPVADRREEEVYFGLGTRIDGHLTCGVWIARGRNEQLAIIAKDGNIYT